VITKQENVLLTNTDADSPMGEMIRSRWIPFLCENEFPVADASPQRIKLLGEDLIVFRDSNGRLGIIDEFCPHRVASLFYGRNEENGIRCIYHGWKFDVNGSCVDMPSEPASSAFRECMKIKSYPVREFAGLAWVYMGSAIPAPELPRFEWMEYQASNRHMSRWQQDCNFLQALEGEVDEAHVAFLHRRLDNPQVPKESLFGSYFQEGQAPRWKILETDFGLACGARRHVKNDKPFFWRVDLFLMPFYTMIAPSDDQNSRVWRVWIPRDNESLWSICVTYRKDGPPDAAELGLWQNGVVAHRSVIPGTTTPIENKGNDYLLDRTVQREYSFTGIHGIRAQDAVVTESCGPIVDRSREHLASSDTSIVAMRNLMLRAARDVAKGVLPHTSAGGDIYMVQSYSGLHEDPTDFDHVPEVLDSMGIQTSTEKQAS
jgi:phthalate 4,5-dioxygenase oxygenase subunit